MRNTDGSITYNEWSFAVGHQLSMAQIVTSAGPDPVTITTDSVGKTIAGAKFAGQGNDLVVDTSSFYKPSQAGAYPIVLATYEIVCSKYPDSATGTAVQGVHASHNWGGPRWLGPVRIHPDAELVSVETVGGRERYLVNKNRHFPVSRRIMGVGSCGRLRLAGSTERGREHRG